MKIKLTIVRSSIRKRLLSTIMKTFIFLFCTTVFSFNVENAFSQEKIKIDQDQLATVGQVFKIIQKQTDYDFIYPKRLFKNAPKIQLKKGEVLIIELLQKSLINNNMDFELSNDNIVIVKSKTPFKKIKTKEEQGIQISGKVVDSNSQPLPGANIVEKGTSNGTQTDFDGNFSLTVASENSTLVISYLGFLTKEVVVNNQTALSITLTEDAASLDEVVVVGYGTVRKSDLTGAVSTVKAKDLPLSANTSVEQALAAKAAGLTITNTSGQPGAGVNILIRGAANVGASNAPLYVIDGFPVGGGIDIGNIGQFGNAGFRSPLNDINPNDIASIEILKDASATAIYGSRAANGVILITTKRGKEGNVKVEYSSNYTTQSIFKWLDLLDGQQYMTERNEVLVDNGQSEAYTAAEIANAGSGTDWFDAISRTGFIHQQNININGGTERTKYLVSINYFDQEGVIKNSDLNRVIGRLNLDQKIGKHVDFGITLTASSTKNGNVPLGNGSNEQAAPLRSAIDFSPITSIRDENGNFSVHPIGSFASTLANPVSLLDITDATVIERLFVNAFVNVEILEGLNARVKLGLDKQSALRSFFSPTTNIFGAQDNGRAGKYYNERHDQLFGATLSYDRAFGDHKFNVLAGYEYQEFAGEGVNGQNTDFITDGLLFNDLNAGIGDPIAGSFKTFNELASYFGRINYVYKDKYLLTASIRRDGSPNFGANNKWGVFPSASVAWRIINEDFMANQNTFSDLKLRLGYGETGNNAISGASALYRTQGNYIYGAGNQAPEFGVQQVRYANPDLKWQTNTEINAGIDFSLFNNRISGSVDYFDKKISDLLGTRQLKTFLPINSIAFNVGATKSSGVEVTLNTRNLTGDFKWNTGINFGTYKDRWTERDPGAILQPYQGQTDLLGSVWIYQYDGIQQIGDPIPAHQPNIQPGQPRVNDLNGVDAEGNLVPGPDGQITPADRVFIGTTAPGFTYGVSNNFSYKGIDFSFFFQGMADRLRYNSTRAFYLLRASSLREGRNVLAEFQDRWTPTNTSSQIPSGTVNSTPGASDRLFWEDAGFLRLRNITLGYTLPSNLFGNVLEKARVYVDVQNAFIITDYTGIDPEYDDIGAYPNQRSFTFGINLTF